MVYSLSVIEPPVVEGANPWGEVEEILLCPDA